VVRLVVRFSLERDGTSYVLIVVPQGCLLHLCDHVCTRVALTRWRVVRYLREGPQSVSIPVIEADGRWWLGGDLHGKRPLRGTRVCTADSPQQSCVSGKYSQHEKSQVVQTAWAVLALIYAKYPNKKVIRQAVELIMSRQQPVSGGEHRPQPDCF
jgi:hypothetical protein